MKGGKKEERRVFSLQLLDQTNIHKPWPLHGCARRVGRSLEPLSPLARTRDHAKYSHESPLDPLRVYSRGEERESLLFSPGIDTSFRGEEK